MPELKPQHFGPYIHGEDIRGSAVVDLVNPTTGQFWATSAECGAEEVDSAVDSAVMAQREWIALPASRRARMLHALADAIESSAQRLGEIESRGNGKPVRETVPQAAFAARMFRYFAGWADRLFGSVIPTESAHQFDFYTREPRGVVAAVIAWNSPIQLMTNKVAPALAAGNSVVVKPSNLAPASVVELARLIKDAGLPRGLVNVVTGGETTACLLSQNSRVAMISLTGGKNAGRALGRIAGERLIPIVMELGGKSPNIVFSDAEKARAIAGVTAGGFGAAGQTCVAGSRLLVQRELEHEVVAGIVRRASEITIGDPLNQATEMGPLISAERRDQVLGFIRDAVEGGATVLYGGTEVPMHSGGFFVSPTVITDVTPDMRCVREEIFGPVLTVQPFDTEAEAIDLANDTAFGLAAGIWTKRLGTAFRVAQALHAGMIWVNEYRIVLAGAPFGGVANSGHGRERAYETLMEYTQTKNVFMDFGDDWVPRLAMGT